jgi:UDPglucose 6-dehydrogenase
VCSSDLVKALVNTGNEYGVPMNVAQAVELANEQQKHYLVDIIANKYNNHIQGKKFAVWGLAFKPQTDDMREAPSITIINELIRGGAQIIAYDPEAIGQAKNIFKNVSVNQLHYVSDKMNAIEEADALLLLTEWREFCQTDLAMVKQKMNEAVIFDGRNQYNPQKMRELGFEYYCIGRSTYVC